MPCEQSLLHEGAPDCPTESKPGTPALLAAAQPSPWLRPAKVHLITIQQPPINQWGTANSKKRRREGARQKKQGAPTREIDRVEGPVSVISRTGHRHGKEEAHARNTSTNTPTKQNKANKNKQREKKAHAPGQSAVRCTRRKKQPKQKNTTTHKGEETDQTKQSPKTTTQSKIFTPRSGALVQAKNHCKYRTFCYQRQKKNVNTVVLGFGPTEQQQQQQQQ